MFFAGRDEVQKALRRVVTRLEKAKLSYAVMDGLAMHAHNYRRTTDVVAILLTPRGFEEFRQRYVPKHYSQPTLKRPRHFVDIQNGIVLDVMLTGHYLGFGEPGPIALPDPEQASEIIQKIHVIKLHVLVDLKLAARRSRDSADVVELVRFNKLDVTFQDKLHPSVRRNFIDCLEEIRRDDQFEAQP